MQDKLIDLVEKETMFNQLQIALQAETAELESWRRQSHSLEQ